LPLQLLIMVVLCRYTGKVGMTSLLISTMCGVADDGQTKFCLPCLAWMI